MFTCGLCFVSLQVRPGNEPPEFTCHFVAWHSTPPAAFEDPYQVSCLIPRAFSLEEHDLMSRWAFEHEILRPGRLIGVFCSLELSIQPLSTTFLALMQARLVHLKEEEREKGINPAYRVTLSPVTTPNSAHTEKEAREDKEGLLALQRDKLRRVKLQAQEESQETAFASPQETPVKVRVPPCNRRCCPWFAESESGGAACPGGEYCADPPGWHKAVQCR